MFRFEIQTFEWTAYFKGHLQRIFNLHGVLSRLSRKSTKTCLSNKIFGNMSDSKVIEDLLVFLPFAHHKLFYQTFFRKSYCISKFLYFFYSVCFKPHANWTVINETIKEIHILVVGGILEFPFLSHVLLRRDKYRILFFSQVRNNDIYFSRIVIN